MYYEARIHEIVEVSNAREAAQKIKNNEIQTYQVVKWISRDKQFYLYAVANGHIDNMFLELAILRTRVAQTDPLYQQVESITNGWIDNAETLAMYFEESELSELIMKSRTQLIIGKPKGDEIAWFTCGCCGKSFNDKVLIQLAFDQDAGYGICNDCQNWH